MNSDNIEKQPPDQTQAHRLIRANGLYSKVRQALIVDESLQILSNQVNKRPIAEKLLYYANLLELAGRQYLDYAKDAEKLAKEKERAKT